MQLKAPQADQLDEKLRPVSKIMNPKSACTHYLQEFTAFYSDTEINMSELNPSLADTLFKVDTPPAPRSKTFLLLQERRLQTLRNATTCTTSTAGKKHNLTKAIDATETT